MPAWQRDCSGGLPAVTPRRRAMASDPEEPAPGAEPAPAEVLGLRGARLAARVRQALYHVPVDELAQAFQRMRDGAIARHMDYFMDGVVHTIRVFPCPITLLAPQVAYVHRVVRTLHDALLRMPELYLADPAVRAILRLEPEEDAWLRACWTPAVRARNPMFDRLDALADYTSPGW